MALAIGALFGALLTKISDFRRGAEALRATLIEAVRPYLDAHRRDRQRPGRFFLDQTLVRVEVAISRGGTPVSTPPHLATGGATRSRSGGRLLECHRVWDSDALADVSAKASGIGNRFGRWQRVNAAYDALTSQIQRLDRGLPVRADGEDVLDLAQGEPVDDVETTSRVGLMNAFTQLAEAFDRTHERFERARRRLGEDSGGPTRERKSGLDLRGGAAAERQNARAGCRAQARPIARVSAALAPEGDPQRQADHRTTEPAPRLCEAQIRRRCRRMSRSRKRR